MSECKHIWVLTDAGGLHCNVCNAKVYDAALYATDGEKCVAKLKQQLGDLRTRMEAAQDWINKSADVLEQAETDRDNLQAQLQVANAIKDDYEDLKVANKKLNNQVADLQAAYEVVRGALEFYANTDNYSPDDDNVVGVGRDGKMIWGDPAIFDDCGKKAQQALSTTPADASERVKALVELAELIAGDESRGAEAWARARAKRALEKYRGGAIND